MSAIMSAEEVRKICPCPNCKGHDEPKLAAVPEPAAHLRLDLGCGKNKQAGFTGVDNRQFDGVDMVLDLTGPWPWKDDTVDEVHCSHFVEHLTGPQRVHFVNELHRVLKKGAKATIIVPSWKSARAYGDVTHQWPPVSEFWFPYLDAEWRKTNAPHNDSYTCDFPYPCGIGYAPGPVTVGRTQDVTAWMLTHYLEAAQDLMATLVKR